MTVSYSFKRMLDTGLLTANGVNHQLSHSRPHQNNPNRGSSLPGPPQYVCRFETNEIYRQDEAQRV